MDVHIPDYVLQVLARFGPVSHDTDGWLTFCPCPTHSGKGVDKNPSLRITIGDEGKLIVHCRTGCSNEDVLSAVGLTYADLFCPTSEEPADTLLFANEYRIKDSERPVDLYHRVYSAILQFLHLADSHLEDLKDRGITPEQATTWQYRSLISNFDATNLRKKLNKEFGSDLQNVPGFRPCPDNPAQFEFAIDPQGLLIPIRSPMGEIISLKTRRPITPKYIIWSTYKGPSAGTPVHCPLTPPVELNTLRITEGEIKADIAYARTGTYTISIPGVNAWPSALSVLEVLNPKRVLLSFDYADLTQKGGVARLLRLFAEELVLRGYEIGLESWDITNPKAKGIDDALTLNITPVQTWGHKALEIIRKIHDGEKQPVAFFDPGEPAPFPMDVFPTAIREFISQHSQAIQCPEDFMASAILGVSARALGTSRSFAVTKDWNELPNQYMCIVAPPSSGKSPACKRVLKPIRRLQKVDAVRYAEEMQEFMDARNVWREEVKTARRNGSPIPDPPQRPRPIQHYWVSDITVETVAQRLHNNAENVRRDPALLYYRDEILAWIKSLNAYRGGKGADKEFFLSTWSNEDVKVDRKTEDQTVIVSSPALTILGGIQPDLLSELSADCNKDDGFFARLLFSFPNTKVGFEPSSFVPDEDLEKCWDVICRRLLALTPLEEDTDVNGTIHKISKPKPIGMSDSALMVWNEWLANDAEMMRSPSFPAHLLSSYGKHRAILVRLALVLHYLHGCSIADENYDLDQPVSASTMRAAIRVLNYFRAHFLRVVKRIEYKPEDRRIELFVKHVIEHYNGSIPVRDIYKKKLFQCRGREEAEELCKLASDRGFGILEKSASGGGAGRPSLIFLIQSA